MTGDPSALPCWVKKNSEHLSECAPFGNHRKRETHKPGRGTPDVVGTYVKLVGRSQVDFLRRQAAGDDPFDGLYIALKPVSRFGRLARYDFVRLLANLGILESIGLRGAQPRRCYLDGATGPLKGARRMFGAGDPPQGGRRAWLNHLEQRCIKLAGLLGCDLQVIEDALCNWQKKDHSESCGRPARKRSQGCH